MEKLPYGWSEQYALREVLNRSAQMEQAIDALQARVAELEAEIARLDVQKANRAGRPRKATAQVNARPPGERDERSH